MKNVVSNPTILLPLLLATVEAKKASSAGQTGGTQVTTSYNFGKDKFASGDKLWLRDLLDSDEGIELLVREAKKKGQSGGNTVNTNYNLKGDSFGPNANLYMNSQTQVKGGNNRRWIEDDLELYARDFDEDLYVRDFEAELFARGGKAKGGDSKTSGGNTMSTNNNIKGGKFGANSNFYMQSQSVQKGGNTYGGQGGAGSLAPLPPLRRDASYSPTVKGVNTFKHGHNNAGSSGPLPPLPRDASYSQGMDTFTRGGNNAVHHFEGGRHKPLSNKQVGGNTHGANGGANSADGAPGASVTLGRRGGFLSGGNASGGSSHTKGGNNQNTKNNVKGGNYGGGTTINMQTKNSQNGGNTKGGNGGMNTGNGGGGGGLSSSFSFSPMPMRRDLEELYGRDIDELIELYVRGGVLSGGDAKGGSSHTKGGNNQRTSNSVKGGNYSGGTTVNMQTQNSQRGGNTKGGKGGNNSGNGGAGGQFSMDMSMPMPMRRDAEFDEDLFGRDAEMYDEIYAREAFADPEAEAEAEFYEFDY